MPETMIERVARAIADHESALPSHEAHIAQARAAFTAIREPTAAMLKAGASSRTAPSRFSSADSDDTLAPEWQAMIDAALAEQG